MQDSCYTADESTASQTNFSSLSQCVWCCVFGRFCCVYTGEALFCFRQEEDVEASFFGKLCLSEQKRTSFKDCQYSQLIVSSPFLLCLQVTICSWWQSMSWVMLWVWSTPTIPAPSWLLSTSIWTRTTSNCLWTTCRAYRKSTVSS